MVMLGQEDIDMKKRKWLVLVAALVLLPLLFAGCAPTTGTRTQEDNPAGFFMGVWHGWIAPISLVISMFNHNVHIYDAVNVGFWYDLGYYMAVISGFGGLALFRRRKKGD